MSTTITDAFITLYDADVKLAYQRGTSFMRGTIRTKSGVIGSTVRFQKLGTGTSAAKTRHGDIPLMNATHTHADATLVDQYAADYVDVLDELKINIDERQAQAMTGAMALGRFTDSQIITAADGTSFVKGSAVAALDLALMLEGWQTLADNNALDGDLFGWVTPRQWTKLLQITQFANADFISDKDLPFLKKGTTGKSWMGVNWMMHTGLTIATNVANNLMYNRSALGHAIGQDVTTKINYVAQKDSNLVSSSLSMGAVLIEDAGVVILESLETA